MGAAGIPEEHFTNVGRVVVAATNLEMMGAWVIFVVDGGEAGFFETPWFKIANRPGKVAKRLQALADSRPDADYLAEFNENYKELQSLRHRFVHNVVVLEFPNSGDPNSETGMTVRHGDPVRWTSVNPRDGSSHELPADVDVDDLIRRIDALAARAMHVGTRLVADSSRTREQP